MVVGGFFVAISISRFVVLSAPPFSGDLMAKLLNIVSRKVISLLYKQQRMVMVEVMVVLVVLEQSG